MIEPVSVIVQTDNQNVIVRVSTVGEPGSDATVTASNIEAALGYVPASDNGGTITDPTFAGTIGGSPIWPIFNQDTSGSAASANEANQAFSLAPNSELDTPASGDFSVGAFTWPTFNQSTTGTAASAATLTTPRTINGVSFNGSANITVAAASGTLTGTTLASNVTASSLTSFGANIALGTPATGTLTNCTGLPIVAGTTGTLSVARGGTGSATQNFIDLTTAQTAAGAKTFSNNVTVNGVLYGGVIQTSSYINCADYTTNNSAGGYQVSSRLRIYGGASDGLAIHSNGANSAGVTWDLTTSGTAKLRNFNNSADGTLIAGTITATGGINPSSTTVGSLPTASTVPYQIRVVTDALAPVAGASVASGGSAKALVSSDGVSAWKVILAY